MHICACVGRARGMFSLIQHWPTVFFCVMRGRSATRVMCTYAVHQDFSPTLKPFTRALACMHHDIGSSCFCLQGQRKLVVDGTPLIPIQVQSVCRACSFDKDGAHQPASELHGMVRLQQLPISIFNVYAATKRGMQKLLLRWDTKVSLQGEGHEMEVSWSGLAKTPWMLLEASTLCHLEVLPKP